MHQKSEIVVPEIGSPFEGGFFAGTYTLEGKRFALVVAPKAEGEKLECCYKLKDRSSADGTDLDDDGMANSELINDDNHPAAQFCRSLQIGGFDDWFQPSRDELMHIWMNLGPNRKKTPDLFKSGSLEAFDEDWYWTSTETASNPYFAWLVGFFNGYQYNLSKGYGSAVRAVRRLSI